MTEKLSRFSCRSDSAAGKESASVVVTDSNVLINLSHIGRIELLGKLAPFSFVVPEEVVQEITDMTQAETVREAIDSELLRITRLDRITELAVFADLGKTLGTGEAACLRLAESRGWLIASDERKTFYREAVARLGQDRIINTPGILLQAIRLDVLTVEEADEAKALLEQRRFKMAFKSFRELVAEIE